MILDIIFTILFWVGVIVIASALAYVPKYIRLYYVLIVLGNLLILLCSPLMIQSDWTIFIMTIVMISAQWKNGYNEINARRWGRL